MMGAPRRSAGLATLLALACVALAAILGVEAYTPAEPPASSLAAPVAAADHAEDLPARSYESKPLDSYSEIAERPVFSPSRRPSPAERRSADGGGRSGHDNLMLAGVIMAADKRLALIETAKTSGVVVVREGQSVEGWTIDAISAEKVVISQGIEVFELLLDDKLKVPRKQLRRTPRTAPAVVAATASPPDSEPASAPAPPASPEPDSLPLQGDTSGAAEELTE